jgi:hypothetical protein
MSRYLDLADRALESITEQSSNDCKPMDAATTHYEIDEFNEISLTRGRLRILAGKDWPEVSSSPEKLGAFATLVAIKEMRERGIAPDHYTAMTKCDHCGPVPIWEGCLPTVLGCPWCMNRHRGLPIPKARNGG